MEPRRQCRNIWEAIEQVNDPFALSITYRQHYIFVPLPQEVSTKVTPRITYKGCIYHIPYHRDLRPKCVIMNNITALIKFSVHHRNFTPRVHISRSHKDANMQYFLFIRSPLYEHSPIMPSDMQYCN
ncbi:unnamed protein product [Rhizophagus irregularis]|nr:unnamed protein product [Rhizophagus irregularis]